MNIVAKGHIADHIYPAADKHGTGIRSRSIPAGFPQAGEGSVRDVKSLRKVLEEIDFDGVLVLDTGFSSQDLA